MIDIRVNHSLEFFLFLWLQLLVVYFVHIMLPPNRLNSRLNYQCPWICERIGRGGCVKHEMSMALLIDTKLYSLRHITHWFILFHYLQPIAKIKSETTNWRKIKWNFIEQSKQKIENENKITIAVFAFCIVFQTKQDWTTTLTTYIMSNYINTK